MLPQIRLIECRRCRHIWYNKSKPDKPRIACPKCRTSIVSPKVLDKPQPQPQTTEAPPAAPPPQLPKEFTLDIKVINHHTWSGAVGRAKALGNPIVLIPNKHGELNLKLN